MSFKTPTTLGTFTLPSTLSAVLGQAIEALSAMANPVTVQVGGQYLESFGAGSPAKVLFVPEARGKVTRPSEMGNAAAMVHSCAVYVRGEEGGTDLERFDAAYALSDLVIDLIGTGGAGRVEWQDLVDDSPVKVASGMGAGLALAFTFTRDIRHSAARWTLSPAGAAPGAPEPVPPPGQLAGLPATVVVTVTPDLT